MKRIVVMLVVLCVSALGSQRLDAQACQVSLGTFAPPASIRSIAVEGPVGAVFDLRNTEVLILDTTRAIPTRCVSTRWINSTGSSWKAR